MCQNIPANETLKLPARNKGNLLGIRQSPSENFAYWIDSIEGIDCIFVYVVEMEIPLQLKDAKLKKRNIDIIRNSDGILQPLSDDLANHFIIHEWEWILRLQLVLLW